MLKGATHDHTSQHTHTHTHTRARGARSRSTEEISDGQKTTLIEWARQDLAAKKITQAQFDEMATELNMTPEQRAPDTRSDGVKALDAAFPAAKPDEFAAIRYYPPGQEPATLPKEVQQFDQSARTWLSEGQFTRELGNSLVNQISRVAQQTHHMSEVELEQYGFAEYAKLRSVFGDALEAKLQASGRDGP